MHYSHTVQRCHFAMAQTLMNNTLSTISKFFMFILVNKVVYFTILNYLSPVLVLGFYQLHKMNRRDFFILNLGTVYTVEKSFPWQLKNHPHSNKKLL